ncbi:MAG: UDP-N-acetylmuramoyl-tripeptide--D-alanyl-D-alanine ligase [Candidatus Omnitrophica bacterium]|nr:UDP-N-acetylmuramoyl-tripeptide--D-alanyl-D-alanine ligase [Candidatus Omnitrophota bacterium]MCM8789189.1 UDP-N-acetylmuramoyl-tripeptide--D-alanyl-D-alanine ligase [Candidatus Omnitrophota bacterium]
MEPVTLKEIIDWTGGKTLNIRENIIFENISTDSRTANEGSLFVALKGKNFDGHDFAFDAIKAGARAVIVDHCLNANFSQIIVLDTHKALGDIAANYRRRFSCPVIGITGSDGKTTTKEICAHILSTRFNVCKNQGNFNNEIGLPLSIFSMTADTEIGIFELGMNGYGQLRYLSSILQPDIAIITSVGYAHLGFFKSRSDLAVTKAEILQHTLFDGLTLVNNDTGFIKVFSGRTCSPPVRIGMKKCSDFRGIMYDYDRDIFTLRIEKWNGIDFKINSWNGAIAYPALFSIFIADYFGVPRGKIAKSVYEFGLISGRGKVNNCRGIYIFDESYNANPASMKMALYYFGRQKAKRKIAIIGSMAELGKWSEFYHREIARIVKNLCFDAVFTVGDDARIISKSCGEKGRHFKTSDEISEYLCNFVKTGDAILVKGSRMNKLEIVVQKLADSLEK